MSRNGTPGIFGQSALPLWLRAVLFGAAYFVCAEAGGYLSSPGGTYVSFWLPAGLYVSVLLLNERRHWPWLALAALGGNATFDLLHGTKPIPIFLFYCANTVQATLGAWLVQRFVAKRPTLATLKEFSGLLCFAAVLSTMPGAVIGAGTLVAFGLSPSFTESWKVWWGSCAMAILVLSPFILAWAPRPERQRQAGPHRSKKVLEAIPLFAGLSLSTWYILVLHGGILSPLKIWLIPFLLWAGLRFGVRGATGANLLLSLLTAFFTTRFLTGLTPDAISSGDYVFILQTILAVATMVGIVPAIVIGERDRTTAELRESEERFRNLTAAAFEGIGISENGRIVDANDQMLNMFGFERAEILGYEIINLVAPESRAIVADAIRAGQESIYEHRLLRKDGSSFYAEARAKMVRVGNRTLRMTALRDITERKQAEEALRESEEKFSKAFRASPDAIALTDLETGRYIDVNEGHERLFGFSRDEIIGRTTLELGIYRDAEDRQRLVEALRTHGLVRDLELHGWNCRHEPVTVLYSGEIIELGGKRCIVSILHDITDRVRAERALRESEAKRAEASRREQAALEEYTRRLIESQEAERRRIASELHDSLGQNLSIIKNRAHLARQLPDAPQDAVAHLEAIERIVADAITETRNLAHNLRPLHIEQIGLTDSLQELIREVSQSSHTRFERRVENVDDVLKGEAATNLYRIVQEALNNLVKHSGAQQAVVTLERDVHSVRLRVADDGVGFDAAAARARGGLGLTSISERARMLGGSFTLSSTPGQGTQLLIEIPLPDGRDAL